MKAVKVLLVDDSPLVLAVLERILSADPEIEVVGKARHGLEALALIPSADPDVICTDLYMPTMNGLELTRRVMAEYPRPILVVSVAVSAKDPENVFQVLEAGALDVFSKPPAGFRTEDMGMARELCSRIKLLSRVHVFRRPLGKPVSAGLSPVAMPAANRPEIVAIGASAGGPQALAEVLSGLGRDFPLPLLCVQHISEGFLDGLVAWLGSHSRLAIGIVRDGEPVAGGRVYFPAEGHHLVVTGKGHLGLSAAPPRNGHRPSVDVTFESMARHYGASAVAVLLSGMGADGAHGMLEVARAGGMTVAQDEATSLVFGMPAEAIRLGAVRRVLPVEQIAPALQALCGTAVAVAGERSGKHE